MSADQYPRSPAPEPLVRRTGEAWLGGVCVGIARHLDISPLLPRVMFVILSSWKLTGVLAYFLLWLIVPRQTDELDTPGIEAATRTGFRTPTQDDKPLRADSGSALAVSFFGAGLLWVIQARGLGLPQTWFLAASLACVGLALVWYQADHASTRGIRTTDRPIAWLVPLLAHWSTALGVVVGVLFVTASVVMVAALLPNLGAVGRTLAGIGMAIAALIAMVAPWLLRVRGSLMAAREAKLVSDARADMAAHLHDSVLQTLALIQKRAGDQREVTRLARRQERELRAWLYGEEIPQATLHSALEDIAQEIEDNYPIQVELVSVGDTVLTPALSELVRAAKEALSNAAKHSGADAVDVYAEVDGTTVEVFVRDRGKGFELNDIPEGRMGIGRSIMERMERHGGKAHIRSATGTGTEVTLEMNV